MATYREKFGRYEVRSEEAGNRWFKDLGRAERYYDELLTDLAEDLAEIGETDEIKLVDLKTGEVLRQDTIGTEEEAHTNISEDKVEAIEAAIKIYFNEIEDSIRVCRERRNKTVKFNINWGGIGGATAERALEYAANLTKAATLVNWINQQKWETICYYSPYETNEAYRRDVEKIAEGLKNGTDLEQLI